MNALSELQCSDITNLQPLQTEEINKLLLQLDPKWIMDTVNQTIVRTIKFKNYYQTMAFVNVIAQIAHQQDHHPDLEISYNHCTVIYTTHSVGGLSLKDFICATKINLAEKL